MAKNLKTVDLRKPILKLVKKYGVKRDFIAAVLGITTPTLKIKIEKGNFTSYQKKVLYDMYGSLINRK